MSKCMNCGKENKLIGSFLGLCQECILHDFKNCESQIQKAHQISREAFGLPPHPPRDEGGVQCHFCFNQCLLGSGGKGYCGVRGNVEDRIRPLPKEGFFSWYYDPLPTNCVADWVCPGGTGAGYPHYAYSEGAEYGYKNLAVFYYGCTFNCLFCQNWSHKERLERGRPRPSSDLAQAVDKRTSCVCYFGGDPSPHLLHSIHSSRLALAQREKEILRFCWETNGTMNSRFLEEILDIALGSGGCVKFDLKTFHPNLNMALCGRSNEQTKVNFELASTWIKRRKEIPLVVASTLLVPGYVDRNEVYQIAKFIASLNPDIPYALLGFYPHFYFRDFPVTSRRQAKECQEAALEAGVRRVRIGNLHLLGNDY
jgi:pyruvate formate lyase activating enzyme